MNKIVILKVIEKKNKYLDFARELKILWNMKVTTCNWCSWYSHQKIGKKTKGLSKKKTSGDTPNYSIVEIGQNTEKTPWDLRGLVAAQTPVKDHQLTLLWKTLKDQNNNNNDKNNNTANAGVKNK